MKNQVYYFKEPEMKVMNSLKSSLRGGILILSYLENRNTAPWHLDEWGHTAAGPQGGFQVPQQVIRLQDQDHLPVHERKNVGYLLHVPKHVQPINQSSNQSLNQSSNQSIIQSIH